MANLTTASPAKDFESNLDMQVTALSMMAGKLPSMHNSIQNNIYGGSNHYLDRRDLPDKQVFDSTFSMALAFLVVIVNTIKEAESTLEALTYEDEATEEEIGHAQGELFAAKTMYLSLIPVIGEVETSRLQSTGFGMNSAKFMDAIGHNRAVPQFGENYTRGMPKMMLNLSVDRAALYSFKVL